MSSRRKARQLRKRRNNTDYMEAAKYKILGSDYLGVFGTATDDFLFIGAGLTRNIREMIATTLDVRCVDLKISESDLVGLFSRANSNGILISKMATDYEIDGLKKLGLDLNIGVLESDLNAVGSNVLANDRIAVINPDYTESEANKIADVLGVEVVRAGIGGFKTVGANNILTNTGLVLNNRSTAKEKQEWDNMTGFNSVMTTANTGAYSVGFAAIANSKAVCVGESTTGFELARIVEGLE
ncbi:MAG: translation initiation factor IF-6 [Candidatus Micrarchaeales archaeon]